MLRRLQAVGNILAAVVPTRADPQILKKHEDPFMAGLCVFPAASLGV